jgi:FkbM family methyltransferase
MSLKERLASAVIGTPLQGPLEWVRRLAQLPHRVRHPELREIYLEDSRIAEVIKRVVTPAMNCVDVGCHLGSLLNRILWLSPTGRHTAVEPIPYKAAWLRRKYPSVTVHELALGGEDGEVEFFVDTRRSGFSGLRVHGSGQNLLRLTVTRRRLDDLIPAEVNVGFLKVDVEGGEYDVFRGAVRLLSKQRPVVLYECTRSGLDAFGFVAKQVFEQLNSHHYHTFLFKDYLTGGMPLDLAGFEQSQQYPFQAFNYLAVPS